MQLGNGPEGLAGGVSTGARPRCLLREDAGSLDPAGFQHYIEVLRQGSAGALRVAAASRILQREAHKASTMAKAALGAVSTYLDDPDRLYSGGPNAAAAERVLEWHHKQWWDRFYKLRDLPAKYQKAREATCQAERSDLSSCFEQNGLRSQLARDVLTAKNKGLSLRSLDAEQRNDFTKQFDDEFSTQQQTNQQVLQACTEGQRAKPCRTTPAAEDLEKDDLMSELQDDFVPFLKFRDSPKKTARQLATAKSNCDVLRSSAASRCEQERSSDLRSCKHEKLESEKEALAAWQANSEKLDSDFGSGVAGDQVQLMQKWDAGFGKHLAEHKQKLHQIEDAFEACKQRQKP